MAFSGGNIGNNFDPKGVRKTFQKNLQGKTPAVSGETTPEVPSEKVSIGFTPAADAKTDVSQVGGEQPIVAEANVTSGGNVSMSGVPSLLTNADLTTGFNEIKPGLTAVNGLNSTTLTSLSGNVIASANVLTPTTATKMPTTSMASFGLGDTQFVTSSGRVIDGNQSVKMPTTSLGLVNGLESEQFMTTSGRLITL